MMVYVINQDIEATKHFAVSVSKFDETISKWHINWFVGVSESLLTAFSHIKTGICEHVLFKNTSNKVWRTCNLELFILIHQLA